MKQIESALHSVESELNKLRMTDAQFKQWQVDEKVEKLEKLLGASNPKVIELWAALEKELHDNILKDILSYADPAAAAVAKVDKEYQDFLSNVPGLVLLPLRREAGAVASNAFGCVGYGSGRRKTPGRRTLCRGVVE